jgi:eukaryotic-like serine/threonine-protein kinase
MQSEPKNGLRSSASDKPRIEELSDTRSPVLSGPVDPERIGPYRIMRRIGAGGMGVVYVAEDEHLHRQVALKVLRPGDTTDPQRKERFLREARATAGLEHERIVRVYNAGEADGAPFIAMELLKGEALRARLHREPRLPIAEAIRIGADVAEGLAFAHAHGLIHRDVTPANIWLEPSGRAKVLDFGLVQVSEEAGVLTRTGASMGTPGFMSPEQAAGEGVTAATDQFSLGCVLYQMTTGRPAFPGETARERMRAVLNDDPVRPRDIIPDIPALLDDSIRQQLAKEPGSRPSSVAIRDFLKSMQVDLADGAMSVLSTISRQRDHTLFPPERLRPTRHGGRQLLLVVIGAFILGGLGVYLWTLRDRGPQSTGKNDRNSLPPPGNASASPFAELDASWVQSVSQLPAHEQFDAVSRELLRRNTDMKPDEIRSFAEMDGKIISFQINSDMVEDLTPLRALPALKNVICVGPSPRQGRLQSLEPLRGLPLVILSVENSKVANLGPLAGMFLQHLDISGTSVSNLQPLHKLELLNELFMRDIPVENFEPLRGLTIVAIEIDLKPAFNSSMLNDVKRLKMINGQPASKVLNPKKVPPTKEKQTGPVKT